VNAAFPTCITPIINTCYACDPLRSSGCVVINSGTAMTGGCECGKTGKPCGNQQRCDTRTGSGTCVPIFAP
jgi:hypothetical protein